MPSPFKECQSDGLYTCNFCKFNGTVNCPPEPRPSVAAVETPKENTK